MVNSKRFWPSFPINIGIYYLLNAKHEKKEDKQLEDIWLHYTNFKIQDPK